MTNKILFVIAFGFGAWILVDILGGIVGGIIVIAVIVVIVANLQGTDYHQSETDDDTNLHQNRGILPGGYDNDGNDGDSGGDGGSGDGGGCGGGGG